MGYSIASYGDMIADEVRYQAYRQAIRHAVKPGAVVVDIGTGTGIMALLACQMGPRRVYAIEPSDAIELARELAAANGYADRIEFIQALSTEVELPERAQVIISDLRGALPFFQTNINSIIDARRRFLAPGGVLIPRQDILWAAVGESADFYQKITKPWGVLDNGLKLLAARPFVVNTFWKFRFKAEQLLTAPTQWFDLKYGDVESSNARGEFTSRVTRPGTGHGLVVWFDAILITGIGFTNAPRAPDAPKLIYGNTFFPWLDPVDLSPGDQVHVKLAAHLVGEEYVWQWGTRVLDQGQSDPPKADFKQSTIFSGVLPPEKLNQMASSHVPQLNEDGVIDRCILEMMDGEKSLDAIAREIEKRFSSRFSTHQEILTRVATLSVKYGFSIGHKFLM